MKNQTYIILFHHYLPSLPTPVLFFGFYVMFLSYIMSSTTLHFIPLLYPFLYLYSCLIDSIFNFYFILNRFHIARTQSVFLYYVTHIPMSFLVYLIPYSFSFHFHFIPFIIPFYCYFIFCFTIILISSFLFYSYTYFTVIISIPYLILNQLLRLFLFVLRILSHLYFISILIFIHSLLLFLYSLLFYSHFRFPMLLSVYPFLLLL